MRGRAQSIADRRAQMASDIKQAARRLIAERGAGALSLGEVARSMGLTTPALYRYFPSREELVTALMVEAYEDLSAQTARSLERIDPNDLAARFDAMLTAYRKWALTHAQDYLLIHGAPVTGHAVPLERILPAVQGCLALFVGLLLDAERAGVLRIPAAYEDLPKGVLQSLRKSAGPIPPALLMLAFCTWLEIHGLVWEEIAGHLPSDAVKGGALFRIQTRVLAERLGLIG